MYTMERAIINGTLNEDFFESCTMEVSNNDSLQEDRTRNEDIRGEGNRDKVSGMRVKGTRYQG